MASNCHHTYTQSVRQSYYQSAGKEGEDGNLCPDSDARYSAARDPRPQQETREAEEDEIIDDRVLGVK